MCVRRMTVFVAVACVLVGAGRPALAEGMSLRYRGAIPAAAIEVVPQSSGPSYTAPSGLNVGGGWFAVPDSAKTMSVSVVDDGRRPVAADVRFLIEQYEPLVAGPLFCDQAVGVPVPNGARALYVRVLLAESLSCAPPGVPTTGVISLEFAD